jgi:hypothetical protein
MALVTIGSYPRICIQALTGGGREEGRGDPALINMEPNLAVGLYGPRHDWALGLTR